jgi:triacylglycerol esterase/lipase EstA (alpha/beta hydrolase family)
VSPRRRTLILAVAALVVVVLAVVGVRALMNRTGGGPVDQAEPGPVLLVPGFGGSKTALDQLAAKLRTTGRTATVVTLPGDGTGDLIAQAAALDAAAKTALENAPSVDVVGYSAGGVVTRIWVDRFGSAKQARRIVTLGSPLHGAKVAGNGLALGGQACPLACRQLAPGSELLSQLDAKTIPDRLPWLSVWTVDDETVQPPDSARLPGAVNVPLQSLCPQAVVSHGQLPTDPQVTALVFRGLAAAPLTAPTGCESVSP